MSRGKVAEYWSLPNGARVMELEVDPTDGDGVAAPAGSIGIRYGADPAEIWIKLDGDDTGWSQLEAGAAATDHGALTGLGDNDHTQYFLKGTDTADSVPDGVTNKAYTATEKSKLAGIETAADVTDATNVAAAGAAMLAVAQAWTAGQYQSPTVKTSSSNHVAIGDISASNSYLHTVTENSEVDNPTGGMNPGRRFSLEVVANGTHELTWGTYFNWGSGGAAPDISAMSNGHRILLDCYVMTSTLIHIVASAVVIPA